MASLRTHLVKIGNSHGIRIPKSVIQQINIVDEIDIEVKRDCLILKPAGNPRSNWLAMFKAAGKNDLSKEDLDWVSPDPSTDDEEWTWK